MLDGPWVPAPECCRRLCVDHYTIGPTQHATALRTLPVGTGYAVWVGIGAFGVGLAGVVVFGESASPARLGLLALTLVAVVGLSLTEVSSG